MFNEATVFATLAVKDIAAAKQFYGEKLGLQQIDDSPGGVMYQSGDGKLFVYRSSFAGTNQATGVSWYVADVEAAVADLKKRGISFEHYDMPGLKLEGDIHIMGT